MNKQKKILVLDAEQRSALAVVRSLGQQRSLIIVTADETRQALAGQSRYSSHYVQYPSPYHEPQEFVGWLKQYILDNSIDILFPVTEVSSQLIQMHSQQFTNCIVPYADIDTINALANKWKLVQLANRLDLPCPKSEYYTSASKLNPDHVEIYPVVLKPCVSRLWLEDHWLNTSVHIAHNKQQLADLISSKEYFANHDFMLQEYIPGYGAGIFTLYNNSQAVAYFAHQRLREKPPRGGVSVLSASAPLNPELKEIAEQLLTAVNWHGVAMVEFRVANDGTPYLMEVNTRFWGSLQLSIDAGVNFPELLWRVSTGESVPTIDSYTVGQRLRWLLGDLDSLYLVLRDPDFTAKEKFKRLLDFLTPTLLHTRHEVNRLNDIGPAWFELKSYIRNLSR